MQSANPSCHGGNLIPRSCASLLQSRRELTGRIAVVGYSAVVMGTTGTLGPPRAAERRMISRAKPHHVTAPEPASNGDLSRAIGRALGSPAWLKVPSFALKAMFGEGANPILGGQYVVPAVMLKHGFQFRHPEVGEAVEHALKA